MERIALPSRPRSCFVLLLLALAVIPCHAGFDETLRILDHPEPVDRYVPLRAGGEVLLVPMGFGSADRMDRTVFAPLGGSQVVRVDLVYTDFPRGRDLTRLNRERLEVLHAVAPGLFSQDEVSWHLIQQTACSSERVARTLFHGIAITYRPASSAALRKAEIAMIESLSLSSPSTALIGERRTSTRHDVALADEFGDSLSTSALAAYFDGSTVPAFASSGVVVLEMASSHVLSTWEENTVTEVFERNAFNDCTIVADVTGSMAPYTAQLIAWWKLKCKEGKARHWAFFNDGDMTPDRSKIIGRTGGVYMGKASTFKEVQDLAIRAMMNGGGGDAPENDIEALLKAQEVSGAKELVLIADNWAPIKDISLLSKVDRPVHVVLCGVAGLLNVQYLELARATGGSVHTMEKDLTHLAELHEGEEIEVGGQWYRLEQGKFVHVVRS